MIQVVSLIRGPVETNGYLVFDKKTKDGIVIDVPIDSCKDLLQQIKNHGLKVHGIYLTHSHFDHMGEANCLKNALNISVFIHPDDKENLEKPGVDGLGYTGVEPVEDAIAIIDGQAIDAGSLHFTVLHTPGHSPGCICFYFEKEKILFSGDTMFNGGFGRVDFPTSDYNAMQESLRRLNALPEDVAVYCGHGEKTSIREERLMKY